MGTDVTDFFRRPGFLLAVKYYLALFIATQRLARIKNAFPCTSIYAYSLTERVLCDKYFSQ